MFSKRPPLFLKRTIVPVLIFLFSSLLTACSASVEGETSSWEANLKMMDRLTREYPGFSEPLSFVKKTAEASWARALEVSKEEEKIAAMQSANSLIDNSFAQKLSDMPGMVSEIGRIRKGLKGKTMSTNLIKKLNSEADNANAAIANAEHAMALSAESLGSAEDLIGPSFSSLKKSLKRWKDLKSEYNKEQKAKKKGKKSKK